MVPIIDAILKAAEKCMDLGKDLVASLDESRFSAAVTEFYGAEPTTEEWDLALKLIEEDTETDLQTKVALLKEINTAKQEAQIRQTEMKVAAAKQLDEHVEKKGAIVKDIAVGVLTAGISLIPKAVNAIRENAEERKALPNDNVVADSEVKD